MSEPMRLARGGLVDRTRPIEFQFDGASLSGLSGDTLASALLANDKHLVGRSFKYHRPRGIYTAGIEEPNALVTLGTDGRTTPNLPATMIELTPDLVARSQNRWPSLRFDVMGVNSLLSPLIPAGFYYKTFMWPASTRGWMFWERHIRRAAGLGKASGLPDPDRYEHCHAQCDVLIVGTGPAGIAAAVCAAAGGARVMLVDEHLVGGGALLRERVDIDGQAGNAWAAARLAELRTLDHVTLLQRTTAFGVYDDNLVGLVERTAPPAAAHERLWLVRAQQVVLATGAIERPLMFPNNDRPGVMLAGAARTYLHRFGVAPGRRAVVFANNDDAYRTALDLHEAGVAVAAVIDARPQDGVLAADLRARGIDVQHGQVVHDVRGKLRVNGVRVGAHDATRTRDIGCDLVCVSGGWSPTVHLYSHTGGKPRFEPAIQAFVPGAPRAGLHVAGAMRGAYATRECLDDGWRAARAALVAIRRPLPGDAPRWVVGGDLPGGAAASFALPVSNGKVFVDLQHDVTSADVALAARENYRSVEHLKRYTTLGMGTDQGKLSNVNGLALLATAIGAQTDAMGTTTFRPPYAPVSLGAMAGPHVGRHFAPIRRTPMHEWHAEHGAPFVEAGLWLRPRCYPRAGESIEAAIRREARTVREAAGLVDVSTLGKIDVQGPDAVELLERVYVNKWRNLALGKARYGLMLREDGLVLDDGTCARVGESRYFMTTTTANAGKVMSHLEFLLQVVWPELRVAVTSLTDTVAAMALAGPRSREILARAMVDTRVDNDALPHMGWIDGRIAGFAVRVFRNSYSGERAYEVTCGAHHGRQVWEALLAAGEPDGLLPYGTEAMGILRTEKGHVAGPELDGRTTAEDLNLGRLVNRAKDFVGRRLGERDALRDPGRKRLVGLTPVNTAETIRAGAQLIAAEGGAAAPVPMLGHVTSASFSPTLGHSIALGLVAGGLERRGEVLRAAFPLRGESVLVRVVEPVFVDPAGEKLRA